MSLLDSRDSLVSTFERHENLTNNTIFTERMIDVKKGSLVESQTAMSRREIKPEPENCQKYILDTYRLEIYIRMRRSVTFKSEEELQSEIFMLKRQLVAALDGNQLLKVKVRKLQSESRKKDGQIEHLMNPKKNHAVRRILSERGTAMILKLEKRNAELEEMLLEKELQNRKYQSETRTMRLYSNLIESEGGRRERARASSPNRHRFSPSHSPTHRSPWNLNNISKEEANTEESVSILKALMGMMSSGSSSHSDGEKIWKAHYPEELFVHTRKLIKTVQTLTSQKHIIDQIVELKNTEIVNLSAELGDLKECFNKQSKKIEAFGKRSHSSSGLRSSSKDLSSPTLSYGGLGTHPITKPLDKVPGKSDVKNIGIKPVDISNLHRTRDHRPAAEGALRKKLVKLKQPVETPCNERSLDAVQERSEEVLSDATSDKSASGIRKNQNTGKSSLGTSGKEENKLVPAGFNKTRIEYVFDSEVSSDGDNVYVPSDMSSSFHQAVATLSISSDSETNSN